MVGDGSLTIQEFAMSESLPLATIHDAVLQFLQGRDDLAIYGAQAVNAYVEPPHMTQDIDLIPSNAAALAEEIRMHLAETFTIAVRIREVASGVGFRVDQLRKPKNRHLVDVRAGDHASCLPVRGRFKDPDTCRTCRTKNHQHGEPRQYSEGNDRHGGRMAIAARVPGTQVGSGRCCQFAGQPGGESPGNRTLAPGRCDNHRTGN